MVTAFSSGHRQSQNPKRTPVLPSDSENAPPRRPKSREVSSRYLSLSTSSSSNSSSSTNATSSSITSGSSSYSRRSQSPMLGRRAAVTTPKSQERAVSADRRRPAATTRSSAERVLVTSLRSLSVSFQGESYSLPVSRVKPPPMTVGTPGGSRKGTPERRKAGVTPVRDRRERDRENSRQSDQQQHRWPGSLRGEKSGFFTRSLNYGAKGMRSGGSGSALEELRKSMADGNTRNNVGAETKLENYGAEVRGITEPDRRSRLGDSVNSDVESVSSESTASGNETGRPRGVVVPARFWQDVNNRVPKVLDPDSPVSSCASNKRIGPSKLFSAKKLQSRSPVSSPREVSASRGLSPLLGVLRPASPSKALTSSTGALLRGVASPSRARSGVGIPTDDNNMCGTPSMFCSPFDLRKRKLGENRIVEAHELRLKHNRLLQWRLANAKVENTLLVRKHRTETSLYNTWLTTSKLRHWVGSKKIELQLLRYHLKLYYILKEQVPHLECWARLDRDHYNSVCSAIEALKASTVRLPVDWGAKADVHEVLEAISSAVDMMHAMAYSICSLLAKAEQMSLLVSELSNLGARGHRLLNECKDFLSTTFIPLEVMHCSLRAHALQVQQQPARLEKKRLH